jgi:uncharacterized membrane-anchored protein
MIARKWLVPVAALVALAQIGFLFSIIAGRASILRNGQTVLLNVEPVDPRDLLRGDYVVLGYNITLIPTEIISNAADIDEAEREDTTIFVRLRADERGIFQPVAARYLGPPEQPAGEGEVDIRGTTRTWWSDNTSMISVQYGIERFYVPEGEGREIERDMNTGPFQMMVAVGEDGAAQIKAFYEGEVLLYAEPLY